MKSRFLFAERTTVRNFFLQKETEHETHVNSSDNSKCTEQTVDVTCDLKDHRVLLIRFTADSKTGTGRSEVPELLRRSYTSGK